MPGLISSLLWTAGLPLFISFSTSYRELGSPVRRDTRDWQAAGALPEAKHRKSIDNPGEERLISSDNEVTSGSSAIRKLTYYQFLHFVDSAWGFGYPKGLVRCCAWGLLWALKDGCQVDEEMKFSPDPAD
jgi:hypothetical protein